MNFELCNLLTAATGAFIGGFLAFIIAKWTLDKTIILNYREFVYNYHNSQIHFENFIYHSEKLLCGTEKEYYPLVESDFKELRKAFILFLKELDQSFSIEKNKDLLSILILNEQAPPFLYKDLNTLVTGMAIIENEFFKLYRHRFIGQIEGLKLTGLFTGYDYLPDKFIKKVKKKNKKIQRQIGI